MINDSFCCLFSQLRVARLENCRRGNNTERLFHKKSKSLSVYIWWHTAHLEPISYSLDSILNIFLEPKIIKRLMVLTWIQLVDLWCLGRRAYHLYQSKRLWSNSYPLQIRAYVSKLWHHLLCTLTIMSNQ